MYLLYHTVCHLSRDFSLNRGWYAITFTVPLLYHNFLRLSRGFSNFFDCRYSPFQNRLASSLRLYYSTFKAVCQALFYLLFKVHSLAFCTYYSTSSRACQELFLKDFESSLSLSAVRLSHFLIVLYHRQERIARWDFAQDLRPVFGKMTVSSNCTNRGEIFCATLPLKNSARGWLTRAVDF